MSWRNSIKKESWRDTIQSDWKRTQLSIVPPVPTTKEKVAKEVIALLRPELDEKTNWKNSISVMPKDGKDGAPGKDGKRGPKGERGPQGLPGKDGANGIDGKDGLNGKDGATWLLFEKSPDDQAGVDGDFCLVKNNFEIHRKEQGEWVLIGSIQGKSKTGYIGGPKGESAYDIAVKYGFKGTEEEWVNSLGAAQVEFAQIVDEASATVTYIGKAEPGSAESAAVWQIKRITISGSETITTWADGNVNFDNVWDNRASLTYS